MLKNGLRILSPFLVVLLLIFIAFTGNQNPNPGLPAIEETILPMSDDPLGRSSFDFMRLKNPTTNEIPKDIRKKEKSKYRKMQKCRIRLPLVREYSHASSAQLSQYCIDYVE